MSKTDWCRVLLLGLMPLAPVFAAPVAIECPTKIAGKVRVDCPYPNGFAFSLKKTSEAPGIEILTLVAERATEGTVPAFTLNLAVSRTNLHHMWHPFVERYPCGWAEQRSSVCEHFPVRANFDDDERNVFTLALSDALHEICFTSDVKMRDGNAHVMPVIAYFFDSARDTMTRYEVKIRLDARRIFWSEALAENYRWIAETSGCTYAVAPSFAYEPLYSSWYVFRSGVTQAKMDVEIEKAAALGMKTVILDDGWQGDRGTWTVDEKKFPDLRAHVAKAHKLGLRYLVWFAVPFVTTDSAVCEKFRGKFLTEKPAGEIYRLDPRYPEVRAHLVGCVRRLMTDYALDGLKLDFIDDFVSPRDDLAARKGFAGCDHRGIPEATVRLLKDLHAAIVAVKPDAMIEFRQHYVGPVARQYGNLLRACDCPGDFESNRYRTLALRVCSPESAIHSDMLLWNADDSAVEVKRQVWNVMFSTVQYSALLDGLRADHLAAIRETIAFLKEHRETLQKGAIRPHHPELGYTWVEAESAQERIVAVYDPDTVVRVSGKGKPTHVVNATTAPTLVVEVDGVLRREAFGPSGVKVYGIR